MRYIFYGKIADGTLKITNRRDMDEAIRILPAGKYTVTLEKLKSTRSLMQNAYFWKVVVPMVQEGLKGVGMKLGKEATHELLKFKFLQKEIVNEETGEVFSYIGSTTTLSKTQFMEYIEDIQRWAAEYLNIKIPSPNEQLSLIP